MLYQLTVTVAMLGTLAGLALIAARQDPYGALTLGSALAIWICLGIEKIRP